MPSMMELSDELGTAALKRGDYKEARKQFRYMVKESRKYGEKEQAGAWNRLGTACTREGRFKEAEEAFRTSLDLTEQFYGPSHPAVGVESNNLAFVLWKGFGDRAKAKVLFEKSVQMSESAMPFASDTSAEHIDQYAECFENLAMLLADEGDRVSAEKRLRQALKIKVDALGKSSPVVFKTLLNLTEFLDKQGRSKESKELLNEFLPATQRPADAPDDVPDGTTGPNAL